jgi:hypothetical protein
MTSNESSPQRTDLASHAARHGITTQQTKGND